MCDKLVHVVTEAFDAGKLEREALKHSRVNDVAVLSRFRAYTAEPVNVRVKAYAARSIKLSGDIETFDTRTPLFLAVVMLRACDRFTVHRALERREQIAASEHRLVLLKITHYPRQAVDTQFFIGW